MELTTRNIIEWRESRGRSKIEPTEKHKNLKSFLGAVQYMARFPTEIFGKN